MKNLINEIFDKEELKEKPPVLVDVGASGEIHNIWKSFAKHSICIAFDADDREFSVSEDIHNSGFNKLYKFNCIVSHKDDEKLDFFLTKSPFCSSTLEPNPDVYSQYVYKDNFHVVQKSSINNISISKALKQLNIDRIDWLKLDSQGIDLSIFKSLDNEIQENILTVDFEPGLLENYKGEDTVNATLEYMNSKKSFWLSSFDVRGIPRGQSHLYGNLFSINLFNKISKITLKKTPKWVEMRYLNSLITESESTYSKRDYLLACLFALLNKEYLETIRLAEKGLELFDDDIFQTIRKVVLSKIKSSFFKEATIKVGRKFSKIF